MMRMVLAAVAVPRTNARQKLLISMIAKGL
jgi:hypothetical protein